VLPFSVPSKPIPLFVAIPASPTGINHYQMIAFSTNIQIYFSIENAERWQISVNSGGGESLRGPDGSRHLPNCEQCYILLDSLRHMRYTNKKEVGAAQKLSAE